MGLASKLIGGFGVGGVQFYSLQHLMEMGLQKVCKLLMYRREECGFAVCLGRKRMGAWWIFLLCKKRIEMSVRYQCSFITSTLSVDIIVLISFSDFSES